MLIFATVLHKMIRFKHYRTFIAAILLMVYGFIATPVQLWHHHNVSSNTVSKKSLKENVHANLQKASVEEANEECNICSHHYSVYCNVEEIVFEMPYAIVQSKEAWMMLSMYSSPFFNFTNKGPPAIA